MRECEVRERANPILFQPSHAHSRIPHSRVDAFAHLPVRTFAHSAFPREVR